MSLRYLGNEQRALISLEKRRLANQEKAFIAKAKQFHDTYERLAPQFGYETRLDTRQFDPESPNGKLMIAVMKEMNVK